MHLRQPHANYLSSKILLVLCKGTIFAIIPEYTCTNQHAQVSLCKLHEHENPPLHNDHFYQSREIYFCVFSVRNYTATYLSQILIKINKVKANKINKSKVKIYTY